MRVVAFNGSPKANGNTFTSLSVVGAELEKAGIDFEIINVGNKAIRGCTGCGSCAKTKDEKCIIDDEVNGWIQEMINADGILLGSPVYFSGINGTMKSFLDRSFYVQGANGGLMRHKVGASVVAVRRSGGLPTFNGLNQYINYAEMFMPTTNYWTVLHGASPGEAAQDVEGVQAARILGKNMAWLMKTVEEGKKNNPLPEKEAKEKMNFIR